MLRWEGSTTSRRAEGIPSAVAKLRQVEVLLAQGKTTAEAVRTIGVTEQSYYRWRSEYGGLKLDQVKWSAPHQTGQVTGVDDWLAMNSRGESMRKPEWGWAAL